MSQKGSNKMHNQWIIFSSASYVFKFQLLTIVLIIQMLFLFISISTAKTLVIKFT